MSESHGKLNCTSHDAPISADPDIAGYGVLFASLASSMLTVLTVALGYLSGSLSDESMTDFDRTVIQSARHRCRPVKRFFQCSSSPSPTDLFTDSYNEKEAPRSEAWKQAVSRFILALSDQQLVTGLAILVSGVINQQRLTTWEFYMVLSLAWFSTTSHLATLDALRTYLKAHTVIREVRVFGMICVLAFLLYTFIISVKAACFFADYTYPIQCVIVHQLKSAEPDWYELLGWVTAMCIIVSEYCTRITGLYSDHGLMAPLLYRRIRLQWHGILADKAPHLSPDQALQVLLASSRTRRLDSIVDLESRQEARQQRVMRACKLAFLQGDYMLWGSFFMSLGGVAFSLSYGITQLVMYRWAWAPSLEEGMDSMGFGQIMAVFLLVLPFLAAAETYYDYRKCRTDVPDAGSSESHVCKSGTPSGASLRLLSTPTSQKSGAEGVNTEYAKTLERIKKYLAGDVYYILHIEAQQGDSSTAQQNLIYKKRAVLNRYQRLVECERRIPSSIAPGFLTYSLFFNISLGVALNLAGSPGGSALSLTFAVMVAFRFCARLGNALVPMSQQLELISLEQPETRSQSSNHSEGGERGRDESNSFGLDGIAAARRTATLPLEEGEPR